MIYLYLRVATYMYMQVLQYISLVISTIETTLINYLWLQYGLQIVEKPFKNG